MSCRVGIGHGEPQKVIALTCEIAVAIQQAKKGSDQGPGATQGRERHSAFIIVIIIIAVAGTASTSNVSPAATRSTIAAEKATARQHPVALAPTTITINTVRTIEAAPLLITRRAQRIIRFKKQKVK